MYVVELAFGDDQGRLELRPEHRRQLLEHHADGRVVLAGPWTDGSGSLLIYDVANEDELQQILDADPYFTGPGVTITRIAALDPVVGG